MSDEAKRQWVACKFTPAAVGDDAKLTAEYLAMTPLQKWETLALNGLLGTDEPWIEDMRAALQGQERRIARLIKDADEEMERAEEARATRPAAIEPGERARELLAAEYEAADAPGYAETVRLGQRQSWHVAVALRAITVALSAQPSGEVRAAAYWRGRCEGLIEALRKTHTPEQMVEMGFV